MLQLIAIIGIKINFNGAINLSETLYKHTDSTSDLQRVLNKTSILGSGSITKNVIVRKRILNKLNRTFSSQQHLHKTTYYTFFHKLTLPSEASPLLHPEEPDNEKGDDGREGVLTDVLVELQ